MKEYDYLIVGAGLFGAVFAHEARCAGKRCLVIDKRGNAEATYTAKTWKAYMYTNTVRTFSTQTIKKYGIM